MRAHPGAQLIPGHAFAGALEGVIEAKADACYLVHNIAQTAIADMSSSTFTVRVDTAVKKRLEKLAKDTGRSRSFLAAEAIGAYVDVNEWQIAGIKQAIVSLDRGEGVAHEQVTDWVRSWGSRKELPAPKPRAR